MTPDQQLQWEARMARPAAVAAFGAGLFSIASLVIQIAVIGEPADDDPGALVRIADNAVGRYASLAAQVISLVLLVAALFYLLRATMHRRPEVPRMVTPLLPLAPLLLAIAGVVTLIDEGDRADRFISGPQSLMRAENLLDDPSVVGGIFGLAGTLCLALSFVFVSLNAMRAGLLSRFMGIIGIIVGGLLVLPLVPGGQIFIQLFWVVALGVLFLGRWPGGRGPAWESGEAIAWPSAAERREASIADSVPVDDPRDPVPDDAVRETEDEGDHEREGEAPGPPHPVSKKRKRKRRR